MKLRAGILAAILAVALAPSCQINTRGQLLEASDSQVALRSIQSRVFDTPDREYTLRTVMATLQDLDFVIDEADAVLGSVTATKLDGYALRMTVTVRPKGTSQVIVRANAQFELRAVEDPEPYRNFFIALERAMFLSAHGIEG